MGIEEDEKNNVDGSEKCEDQICGKSVEDPIVDEEREYTSHPAKRRKVSYINYEMYLLANMK